MKCRRRKRVQKVFEWTQWTQWTHHTHTPNTHTPTHPHPHATHLLDSCLHQHRREDGRLEHRLIARLIPILFHLVHLIRRVAQQLLRRVIEQCKTAVGGVVGEAGIEHVSTCAIGEFRIAFFTTPLAVECLHHLQRERERARECDEGEIVRGRVSERQTQRTAD